MRGRSREYDEKMMAIRRQRIIDEAFRLFAERGIEQVTFSEIAEKAGLSRATVFCYFGSKTELAVAVSTNKWSEYSGRSLEKYIAPDATARDRLEFFLDSFIDLYREHSELLRFNQFFNIFIRGENGPKESLSSYYDMINRVAKRFSFVYALAKKDGTMRTDVPETVMFSSIIHIMLAAATRYAVGLIYEPDGAADPTTELKMLRDMMMKKYTASEEVV